MKKNNKLPLYIALLALDFAITVFLLVIAIIMLIKTPQYTAAQIESMKADTMIKFFIKNPTVYLWTCVVPLFLLLAANILVLVLYVKKTAKKEKVQVSDLSEEEKEALRKELLNDLKKENE